MMQVMVIIARDWFVPESWAFKSQMPVGRGNGCMLDVEKEMQGAGWNDKVDQRAAKIEQMLQRVHRQPGPGAGVGVEVMHAVYIFKQGPPMNQAVDEIKVRIADNQDQKEQGHKPKRMLLEAQRWDEPVGGSPTIHNFVSGPNGQAEYERAEHIIVDLFSKEKLLSGFTLKAGVVFALFSAQSECVISQVQSAKNDQHQDQVAQQDQADPTHL